MNGVSSAVAVTFPGNEGPALPPGGAIDVWGSDPTLGCFCSGAKIAAVHAYLKEHFPDRAFRDLHAPTKLMREGVLAERGEYHVVSMTAELPSHAILLKEFLAQPAADVEERLRQLDVACVLRAHRIVIVGREGVSWL